MYASVATLDASILRSAGGDVNAVWPGAENVGRFSKPRGPRGSTRTKFEEYELIRTSPRTIDDVHSAKGRQKRRNTLWWRVVAMVLSGDPQAARVEG